MVASGQTKNAVGESDAGFHRVKMKQKVGPRDEGANRVDAKPGVVRSPPVSAAASVKDVSRAGYLHLGAEADASDDADYRFVDKRQDVPGLAWHIANQSGIRKHHLD